MMVIRTDNELFKDSLHEISGNAAEYIANCRKLQASMKVTVHRPRLD